MGSLGTVTISEIRRMLERCAPGHVFAAHGVHYFMVTYKDKRFPTLPRGEHGRKDPDIQKGVVKKMARHLDILACAEAELAI
jgi:ribosomal protein S27AE